MKAAPIKNPEIKFLLMIKKYIPNNKKNVESISENRMLLKRKKVGENAKNSSVQSAIFLLNALNAIK